VRCGECLAFRRIISIAPPIPKIAVATLTQYNGYDSIVDMSHKAPIPGWVWHLRIEAALKKRSRLVLADKLADLQALPEVRRPPKLPKDVLKLTPSPRNGFR